MSATAAMLMPLLAYLASTAGAGAAASDLFDRARHWWRDQPVDTHGPTDHYVEWLLYTRVGARISVLILAMAISVICSGVIAHAQGQPLAGALDAAIAAALASQVYHLRTLVGQASEVPPA